VSAGRNLNNQFISYPPIPSAYQRYCADGNRSCPPCADEYAPNPLTTGVVRQVVIDTLSIVR
jgi:hypothetical protein